MAWDNAKATIVSSKFQTDLKKALTLASDCAHTYEGEAKMGDQVKIPFVARPTVKTYVPGTDIDAPENSITTSIYLKIDQYKYVNVGIDAIDKMLAKQGVFEKFLEQNAHAFAISQDTYIGTLAKQAGAASTSAVVDTAAKAKAAIDAGLVALWENDVPIGTDVVIEVKPWFYALFKDSLTELYTNNVDLIRKGIVGMYNSAMVRISNLLHNNGTDDLMMIRTKDAIEIAEGVSVSEPFSPEKGFEEAMKILHTYGATVARPKELYAIKARKS